MHVVNNNAAALVLAATALAAGREIIVSRGELIEIGDGFRLPDLLESTGARSARSAPPTGRPRPTTRPPSAPHTAFILKVHPSNYRIEGFTASADVAALAALTVPVVGDIGSGLLSPHPLLPDEPDAECWLRAGAALVTASGDKLLGGPQAGLLLGRAAVVTALARHPLARALRVDKLTIAALEATLAGPQVPVARALTVPAGWLAERAERLSGVLADAGIDSRPVATTAAVGGGGRRASACLARRSACLRTSHHGCGLARGPPRRAARRLSAGSRTAGCCSTSRAVARRRRAARRGASSPRAG